MFPGVQISAPDHLSRLPGLLCIDMQVLASDQVKQALLDDQLDIALTFGSFNGPTAEVFPRTTSDRLPHT